MVFKFKIVFWAMQRKSIQILKATIAKRKAEVFGDYYGNK